MMKAIKIRKNKDESLMAKVVEPLCEIRSLLVYKFRSFINSKSFLLTTVNALEAILFLGILSHVGKLALIMRQERKVGLIQVSSAKWHIITTWLINTHQAGLYPIVEQACILILLIWSIIMLAIDLTNIADLRTTKRICWWNLL